MEESDSCCPKNHLPQCHRLPSSFLSKPATMAKILSPLTMEPPEEDPHKRKLEALQGEGAVKLGTPWLHFKTSDHLFCGWY